MSKIKKISVKNISLYFKLLIPLMAYYYIFYRISSDIGILKNGISFRWETIDSIYLLIIFILMLLNWFLESIKWKLLLKKVEEISIIKSVKSVLCGLTLAIFTPYRVGEFVGRPLLLLPKNRISSMMANFVGSLAQSAVTIGMGLCGLLILSSNESLKIAFSYGQILLSAMVTLISFIITICIYFYPNIFILITKKVKFLIRWNEKIAFLNFYTFFHLIKVLLLSIGRYFIFFSQYYILLHIFDININILEAFAAISLSYLFLFSIPGIPIAEPGIRGSLALFFIGPYSDNSLAIIAASTGLWILNLAIPSIAGSVFILKNK